MVTSRIIIVKGAIEICRIISTSNCSLLMNEVLLFTFDVA